jgi:hypothetical protein
LLNCSIIIAARIHHRLNDYTVSINMGDLSDLMHINLIMHPEIKKRPIMDVRTQVKHIQAERKVFPKFYKSGVSNKG